MFKWLKQEPLIICDAGPLAPLCVPCRLAPALPAPPACTGRPAAGCSSSGSPYFDAVCSSPAASSPVAYGTPASHCSIGASPVLLPLHRNSWSRAWRVPSDGSILCHPTQSMHPPPAGLTPPQQSAVTPAALGYLSPAVLGSSAVPVASARPLPGAAAAVLLAPGTSALPGISAYNSPAPAPPMLDKRGSTEGDAMADAGASAATAAQGAEPPQPAALHQAAASALLGEWCADGQQHRRAASQAQAQARVAQARAAAPRAAEAAPEAGLSRASSQLAPAAAAAVIPMARSLTRIRSRSMLSTKQCSMHPALAEARHDW